MAGARPSRWSVWPPDISGPEAAAAAVAGALAGEGGLAAAAVTAGTAAVAGGAAAGEVDTAEEGEAEWSVIIVGELVI